MSYFIPSFLQKRLLRYTLSQLGILDTDALSLDNLDITWGKKSTVELKQVGVHHDKVAALLKLPDACSLSEAKIEKLRLTVPADLHYSGISVELIGLRLRVDLSLLDTRLSRERRESGQRNFKTQDPPSQRAATVQDDQSPIHDIYASEESQDMLGRSNGLGSTVGNVPDAHELANSFLRSESSHEKSVLHDAMLQSQSVDRESSSDASVENVRDLGVGEDPSLPAFLAAFLKGVVERAELFVEDICVDFVLHFELSNAQVGQQQASTQAENMTLRLSIDKAQIGGKEKRHAGSSDGSDKGTDSQGFIWVRRISISNLHLTILHSSPVLSRLVDSPHALSSEGSPKMALHHYGQAAVSASRQEPGLSRATVASSDLDHRLQPVDGEPVGEHLGESLRAEARLPVGTPPHDTKDHVAEESSVLLQSTSSRGNQAADPDPDLNAASQNKSGSFDSHSITDSTTVPAVDIGAPFVVDTWGVPPARDNASQNLSALMTWSRQHPSHNSSTEDLTQSRLYSHDEAVSMYASALQSGPADNPGDDINMPGAWKSVDTYDQHPRGVDSHRRDTADCDRPHFSPQTPHLNNRTSRCARVQCLPSHDDESPHSAHEALSPISSVLSDDKATGFLPNTETSFRGESAKVSQASTESSGNSLIAKTIFKLTEITISVPLGTAELASARKSPASKENHGSVAPDRPRGLKHQVPQTLAFHAEGINIYGDMPTTKLLLLVSQTAKVHLARAGDGGHVKSSSLDYNLDVDVNHVSWKFFTSISEPETGDSQAKGDQHTGSGAILRAEFHGVKVSHSSGPISSISRMGVKNLTFGDAVENILTLDRDPRKPVPPRHAQIASNEDGIFVSVGRGAPGSEAVAIDVTTLPVKIALNLERLDEILGYFGGISSVIEVGSSMVSTATPIENSPPPAIVTKRRAVHFDSADKPLHPTESSGPGLNKTNIRFGGFHINIQGRQATLRLETKAVKLVKRANIVAVQSDLVKVNGPALTDFRNQKIPSTELRNLRVEYLTVPMAEHLLQLIDLVTPSKLQAEDQFDDSLMVDTLLQQRKKGGLVRITIEHVTVSVFDIACIQHATSFITDLKQLSTMANYLPEDNRPGLLISTFAKTIEIGVDVSEPFGIAHLRLRSLQGAYVTFPLLVAMGVQTVSLHRNKDEEIIGTSFPQMKSSHSDLPVFLARYIGNEMEPVVRVRLHRLRVEYQASLLTALSDLEFAQLAPSSVTSIGNTSSAATAMRKGADVVASWIATSSKASDLSTNYKITSFPVADVVVKESFIGLGSDDDPSKAYIIINRSQIGASISDGTKKVTVSVEKASCLMIDKINLSHGNNGAIPENGEAMLRQLGYVFIGDLLAPRIELQMAVPHEGGPGTLALNVDGGLLLLETCADSFQTLQKLLSRLSPRKPISDDLKYRTETIPIDDMLASFTGHTISVDATTSNHERSWGLETGSKVQEDQGLSDVDLPEYDGGVDSNITSQILTQSMLEDDFEDSNFLALPSIAQTNVKHSEGTDGFVERDDSPLLFHDEHFGNPIKTQDSGDMKAESFQSSPMTIEMKNFHVIWNLFDGYDWRHTRDRISQAVEDVQKKAFERDIGGRNAVAKDSSDASAGEDVIGDFLFNSIYIGIPAQADPADLSRHINKHLHDNSSEVTGLTTSTQAGSLHRRDLDRASRKDSVKLTRSKHHKMTFELKGLACDVEFHSHRSDKVVSVDVKVRDLEVFDHLPTSTWKKFATYMKDAGERESDSHMVAIRIRNLRPVPDLAATEFNVMVRGLGLVK